MKLKDRVVMLTGAGGCIGRATARHLAGEGAKLVLCDLSEAALAPLVEDIHRAGGEAIACGFDVRDYPGVVRAVQHGTEAFGRIDVLICNAGGSAALLGKISPFAESEPETWAFVMGINVQGSFQCVHAVLPQMMARKNGKILLFGSVAGVSGLANRADYSAAKGALISFVKALAMEVGRYNISVNCISPGAIHRTDTPTPHMTYWGPDGNSSGPEPIARMCAFLASDEAEFITGQNYQVDGGRTLGSR